MFMQTVSAFHAAERIAPATMDGILPGAAVAGILAGSLVETRAGWRPVETLSQGDEVSTYDGGFRAVRQIARRRARLASVTEVVHVPGGALGNCCGLKLMPGQHVFVASSVVEQVLDCAGVLVRADALVGHRGTSRRPCVKPDEAFELRFATDEIVYVNSGMLIHCAATASHGLVPGGDYFRSLEGARARAMLALIAAGATTTAGLPAAA